MTGCAFSNALRMSARIVLVLALSVGGCKSPTAPEHEFGVLATFQVGPSPNERFTILITNEDTIREIKAFNKGQSNAGIPNGLVVRGAVSYNKPWSWHIDSENIHMAEVTIEINDGLPSFVEAELDGWAGSYYGPWSVRLISMEPVAAGLYR